MIDSNYKHLLQKVNANEFQGHPPGTLYCSDYKAGGGFSGSPEEVTLVVVESSTNERVIFPPPSPAIVYHIRSTFK